MTVHNYEQMEFKKRMLSFGHQFTQEVPFLISKFSHSLPTLCKERECVMCCTNLCTTLVNQILLSLATMALPIIGNEIVILGTDKGWQGFKKQTS